MAMRTPSARHWRAARKRFSPSRSILEPSAARSTRVSSAPHKERSHTFKSLLHVSAFDPKRTLGWTSVQLDFAVSASKNLFTTQREGAEHVFAHSGRRSLREETCRLARGETPSRRNCTDRRFKDGKAAFPQKWRRGGRQGWRNDRQRVGTRLGVWRTGRPPRSASYGRREDPGAI